MISISVSFKTKKKVEYGDQLTRNVKLL